MSQRSLLIVIIPILICCCRLHYVRADDPAPAFDMSALANIASTVGSNPQLMSMVSSFLGGQKPSGVATSSGSSSSDNGLTEQDLQTTSSPEAQNGEALKRGTRPSEPKKEAATPAAPSMSSIMSMLPGLNLNPLSGLFNKGGATASSGTAATVHSAAPVTTSAAISTPAAPANSAQSIINQVLSAYASGQIPNELIQLSLSGKVPPQMIELALSGQVPPQIIQMVITGQVPMSTINTFLNAMQPKAATASDSTSTSTSTSNSGSASSSSPSVTKSIFEALFKPTIKDGRLMVPTLLGPVPIQIPNVRRFGQMMGGTITNMASLIPF